MVRTCIIDIKCFIVQICTQFYTIVELKVFIQSGPKVDIHYIVFLLHTYIWPILYNSAHQLENNAFRRNYVQSK